MVIGHGMEKSIVFIFDKALTGDEINDIYNGCGIIGNLVGYWNFEEVRVNCLWSNLKWK